ERRRRHMVEQQMDVRRVRQELDHRPLGLPTYARRRPAVMAPSQQTSDAAASAFAAGGDGRRSGSGSAQTRDWIIRRAATARTMKAILMPKSRFRIFIVASAASSIVPVIAFTQNAIQMSGKNRRIGDSGSAGTSPRILRSMPAMTPTRIAMP